jgi:DNA adenine methylase
MRYASTSAARPVLKWAGGKTQLLGEILPRLPQRIGTYYEPFLGSGAVFFALAQAKRFERAVLSDQNQELVDVYLALKVDVEALIAELSQMRYSEEEYYKVRESRPRLLARRAARTIYLNKTGYNGLYRVNRSGGFNVPFGRHSNPTICDETNLRRVAAVLADVTIEVADFEQLARRAKPGDAVYFDPPYLPVSRTASFTAYDRHPFLLEEHERLARVFAELVERGVATVLSNSDTADSRRLYQKFVCSHPQVTRAINSRASSRGPVRELLVTGKPRRAG